MKIVIGRGRNRHVFHVPPRNTKARRIEVERMAEDLKNYICRPAMLNR